MRQQPRQSMSGSKRSFGQKRFGSDQPRRTPARRQRFRAILERLECRVVLDAEISGTVFQQLDASGLFPGAAANVQTGDNLSTIPNVTVSLDGSATTTTSPTGTYQFLNVTPGVRHTVSVQLPAGYVGFNAQSLSYNLTLTTGQQFPNLNFALTPKNQAVLQNLYELVLSRPADSSGFTTQLAVLNNGGSVGQVLNDLYTSTEFKAESQPIASIVDAFFPGTLDVGQFRNSVQLQNLGVSRRCNGAANLVLAAIRGEIWRFEQAVQCQLCHLHVQEAAQSCAEQAGAANMGEYAQRKRLVAADGQPGRRSPQPGEFQRLQRAQAGRCAGPPSAWPSWASWAAAYPDELQLLDREAQPRGIDHDDG